MSGLSGIGSGSFDISKYEHADKLLEHYEEVNKVLASDHDFNYSFRLDDALKLFNSADGMLLAENGSLQPKVGDNVTADAFLYSDDNEFFGVYGEQDGILELGELSLARAHLRLGAESDRITDDTFNSNPMDRVIAENSAEFLSDLTTFTRQQTLTDADIRRIAANDGNPDFISDEDLEAEGEKQGIFSDS